MTAVGSPPPAPGGGGICGLPIGSAVRVRQCHDSQDRRAREPVGLFVGVDRHMRKRRGGPHSCQPEACRHHNQQWFGPVERDLALEEFGIGLGVPKEIRHRAKVERYADDRDLQRQVGVSGHSQHRVQSGFKARGHTRLVGVEGALRQKHVASGIRVRARAGGVQSEHQQGPRRGEAATRAVKAAPLSRHARQELLGAAHERANESGGNI